MKFLKYSRTLDTTKFTKESTEHYWIKYRNLQKPQ